MSITDNSLLYISKYHPGNSTTWIECKRVKNKVIISRVHLAKGNVVSLCSVRRILDAAELQLG